MDDLARLMVPGPAKPKDKEYEYLNNPDHDGTDRGIRPRWLQEV